MLPIVPLIATRTLQKRNNDISLSSYKIEYLAEKSRPAWKGSGSQTYLCLSGVNAMKKQFEEEVVVFLQSVQHDGSRSLWRDMLQEEEWSWPEQALPEEQSLLFSRGPLVTHNL